MDGIGQHNAIFPATTTGYMHGGVWYPNMLNPMADQFQPTHSAGTPDIRNALATAGVLREGHSSEVAQISARLNNVTEVMVSEMHSLRTDIEKLKQGGWTMTVGPFPHQFSHNQSSAQLTKKTIEPETQHTMIGAVTPGPIARSLFDSIRETPAVEGGATDSAKRPRDGEGLSNRALPKSTQAPKIDLPSCDAGFEPSINSQNKGNPNLYCIGRPATREIMSVESLPTDASDRPMPKAQAVNANSAKVAPHLRGKPANIVLPKKENEGNSNSMPQSQVASPPKLAHISTVVIANRSNGNGTNPDEPVPSVEDPYNQSGGTWKPLAIRRLEPLPKENLLKIPPATKTVTFTWDFLRSAFGGSQWSPGLYYIPPSHGPCILPGRTYYALDASYEPYLPEQPGAHGAKLTAFFNSNPEEVDGDDAGAAYSGVPLFICASPYSVEKNTRRYTYFGTYSQNRWSDKLDYDRIVEEVPNKVKMYWAEQLSEIGRPKWVTEALRKHFWPKPEYEGAMLGSRVSTGSVPNEDEERSKVLEDLEAHINELKDWEKESGMKVKLLKMENILEAFEKEDVADPPGLRLWWEYLQCVCWDDKFYAMLVNMQEGFPHKG